MGRFWLDISVSLDGFVAGPNQSVDDPLGEGGEQLHEWVLPLEAWRAPHGLEGGEVNASTRVFDERDKVAATIMGRNMFGGGPGPWGDEAWAGWWGDDPPFHHPVFVLTHHPREPLAKDGGTTFSFVTDGIESALAQAREAAGDRDVLLAGGADVANQYLAAGLLDEVSLHVVPVLLGGGARLFEGLRASDVRLEQVEAIPAPGVTHLRYRVLREGRGDPARSN
ncbi:MAG TPA: dihydrofolate reductase family protein [Actinomycetota bacterium]|nr:dihydrofolate reductase family protein [Actinomycetota bacterium]